MQSKTSCFNRTIYGNWLRRCWPVWGIQILIWLLLLPLPLLNVGNGLFGGTALHIIRNVGGYGSILMNGVFACVAAMVSFSWMYNARSTAFTAALPIRREGLYLSTWLAGFTMLVFPAVVTALLSLLACAAAGTGAGTGLAVLRWLGQDLCMALLFYGLASLCAQFTGTLWVLPAVYTVLNFAVVVYWALVGSVLELLLYGYDLNLPDLATKLSPPVWLFTMDWYTEHFSDWLCLGLYAAFGAVCAAAGLLLLRRRRMESATDTVAVPVLKPVFRWCAAIAAALGMGLLLYALLLDESYQTIPMVLFLLLGGLIGWLAAEMIARKSYRVRSCLKTFPIFAALLAAFGIGCAFGGFGYVKHIPAADTVETLRVDYGSSEMVLTDRTEIQQMESLHRSIAAGKTDSGYYLELCYTLHSGRTLHRSYRVALTEEQNQLLDGLFQSHALEKLERWMSQTRNIEVEVRDYSEEIKAREMYLSSAQMQALLAAVRRDVTAGTLNLDGGWYLNQIREATAGTQNLDDGWYQNAIQDAQITVNWVFYGISDQEYTAMFFEVTPKSEACWTLLKECIAEAE